MNTIDATTLHKQLADGAEIALLDAREHGVFGQRHCLLASCVPLSHLELKIAGLVPNRATRIVVCDSSGPPASNVAARAASRLESLGYRQVAVLAGGVDDYEAQGFEIFSGVNVPSKAFGEYVEQTHNTPHIDADTLKSRLDSDADLVVLDSRPMSEFNVMSIPGGVATPGAELVYRAHVAAPNPATDIVVNCAGRTRSIIGAQSLINAGLPNRVMALENGTMGWQLAGHDTTSGQTLSTPRPEGAALAIAKQRAEAVAGRFGIRRVPRDVIDTWRNDDRRTSYLFDVRSPEEFRAGHLAGSISAPGGQLVQATDEYAAVRNARIGLIDDHGVRATMTASWLLQMGWQDVFVIEDALQGELVTGSGNAELLEFREYETLTAHELNAALQSGESVAVIDFADSLTFQKGHIKDAWWAVRARLQSDLQFKPAVGLLVATSPDGTLAHYAAREIETLRPNCIIRVLNGGNRAWQAAKLPLVAAALDGADDLFYKPYQHSESIKNRMQAYLDWEVGLVEQVHRDGTLRFKSY